VTPGHPPVATHWSTLPGLARQPVFITNVTLLHHSNASFYQVRGFWTVTAQNVIFTRNRIIGEFMYSIDLDSSSSGNLVHNNYMRGCVWEGIFTEYSAVHNIITGNTVVAPVGNKAHIHINGYLNLVVDNDVRINETAVGSGGIITSSQLKMYNSWSLSNRVVGNSASEVAFYGDGGCDNFAAGNRVDVTRPGSAAATQADGGWKPLPNVSQDCIAGVDTFAPVVFGSPAMPN
jgi:hypothetical protein